MRVEQKVRGRVFIAKVLGMQLSISIKKFFLKWQKYFFKARWPKLWAC